MTYEIELKIKLSEEDKNRMEEYLTSKLFNGTLEGGYEQTDYYFDTLEPSFAQNDTALRIRVENPLDSDDDSKKLIEITYKGKKINPNSKTRLEYNLNLVPGTNFASVEGLLTNLGFVNSVQIFKERKNYLLDQEQKIILSMDANELGYFLEIEKIVEDKDLISKTEEYLWEYLQKILGPMPKERKIIKSYLELILESRHLQTK